MKKITLYLLMLLFLHVTFIGDARSQNTFPSTGNVGIGTVSPTVPLEVVGIPTWTSAFWRRAIKLNNGNAMQFSSGVQHYGIGATTPDGLYFFSSGAEDVSMPASYKMVIRGNGNVGIGTITPQAQLDVNGTFKLGVTGATGGQAYCVGLTRVGNAQLFSENAEGLLLGGDATGVDMSIRPNGNVGIGTSNPQTKLAVNGDIFAKKVKVTVSGWPDYVFSDTYKLSSLQAIEAYIKTHKHLEGVPTAHEVETNGMDVGEMNKILLQKMEELTLHVIALDKQNKALHAEVKALKEK